MTSKVRPNRWGLVFIYLFIFLKFLSVYFQVLLPNFLQVDRIYNCAWSQVRHEGHICGGAILERWYTVSAEATCICRLIEGDILIAITHKVQVSEELRGSDVGVCISAVVKIWDTRKLRTETEWMGEEGWKKKKSYIVIKKSEGERDG